VISVPGTVRLVRCAVAAASALSRRSGSISAAGQILGGPGRLAGKRSLLRH
jgi:hypothetical protein